MEPFLIFKTSVNADVEVKQLSPVLDQMVKNWNFDLNDCDKILRVESGHVDKSSIEEVLKNAGFECSELID